jgi:hypothetical protein
MTYLCPHCRRNVLSRRSEICSYCLNPLPSDFLLTAAELDEIEAEERERERRRDERAEAKRIEYEWFITSLGSGGQ